jgi:ElaB/YqjD/DUF883 family membrane-anchored ribosome-binding protein
MLTTHPSSVVQKRDLHVGGLGLNASGALAAVTDPVRDAADSWFVRDAADSLLERVRDAVHEADDYVHRSPWAALAIVALVGVTVGFALSRRIP